MWNHILGIYIWLLPSVNSHMLSLLVVHRISLIAVMVRVRFLFSVRKYMSFKTFWFRNVFSQYGQLNGFSPVWILMYNASLVPIAKLFVQSLHLWGVSSVRVYLCIARISLLAKCFPQIPHLCFSPLWIPKRKPLRWLSAVKLCITRVCHHMYDKPCVVYRNFCNTPQM